MELSMKSYIINPQKSEVVKEFAHQAYRQQEW